MALALWLVDGLVWDEAADALRLAGQCGLCQLPVTVGEQDLRRHRTKQAFLAKPRVVALWKMVGRQVDFGGNLGSFELFTHSDGRLRAIKDRPAYGFKYDIIAKHQKHLYSCFGEYFVSLFDTTLNKPGTLVEVWGDKTAAPDRHKLLSEGIYEYITNRRPNKWRHLCTAKDYLKATNKDEKMTIRFAAGDSCLQAGSTALLRYQEAEPRAVRGAVKPIIIIETCDGWIIITIIIIWWIRWIKKRKCIACPELDGIENIQVATQPVSSGKRDITDPTKLVKLIQQQHPNLTLRGMVAGFLLNGGSHFPRVVNSLPEAFTLLETHNNIQEVVEVVSSKRLAEGKPMPTNAAQLIYDITLAAIHGPVLADISDRNDEHIRPLVSVDESFVEEELGEACWD
ncbi:unnamed protein product [Vitrella brassicaformis CCMP3155]|uniref:Uncharacterized protein n=1 Tax=Vitrella brassicaformis (strain CCMP3155) TaxID=1169540 RepID=A0A0G4G4Q8_VITBC|nr:unnamed protein product [Vitrella brassicaformis CCMP3155]|eukprot:CEM23370.1 unnamed protein product [Vitrella brassicaformis CCMP3155]